MVNHTSQNKVELLGFIGQEMELRVLAAGKTLARTSLATNEFRKTEDGAPEKITTWHNLIAWGITAQEMSEHLHKGDKVYIEGKLQYRTYETKTGEKRYSTEIQVTDFKKITHEEEEKPNPYTPAIFSIDGEGRYPGIHIPTENWNGWAIPYFKREEARRVLKDLQEQGGWLWGYYEGLDCFLLKDTNQNHVTAWPYEKINGEKYFSIGGQYLTWTTEEDEV